MRYREAVSFLQPILIVKRLFSVKINSHVGYCNTRRLPANPCAMEGGSDLGLECGTFEIPSQVAGLIVVTPEGKVPINGLQVRVH